MIIDSVMLESLRHWGHTWTSGRPVRLEIRLNEFGEILCDVFYREVYGLGDLHPISTTKVGTL